MSDFQFKRFGISQDRCAMKVGTDGVLLGAWAEGGSRILDVGSGTGLISLMMAQRFPLAQVIGIDMDGEACSQASENVASSPFSKQVSISQSRLQDFTTDEVFDSIVSNPPFFVNSMKNPDNKRSMARHADTLPFRDLWNGVKRLLSEEGCFSVILPSEVVEQFVSEGCISGFYLVRRCAVKTVGRKAPKRFLLAFSRHRNKEMEDAVEVMLDASGKRSDWYVKLTDEFYI